MLVLARRSPLLVASLLLAAACASAPAARPEAKATPAPAPALGGHTLVASLKRGPCYGACPVYEARLYADGVVEWNGVRSVLVVGQATASVSAAKVEAARAALAEAGFAGLEKSYLEPGLSDVAWVEVSDGKRTVRRTTTAEKAPPALLKLEGELDRLLGTDDFIRGKVLDR